MAKYATRQSANKAKGPNQRVVQDGKGFKLVATNSLAGRASTTRTGNIIFFSSNKFKIIYRIERPYFGIRSL